MLVTEWTRRLWYLINRRRLDRELRQEMEAHRAMLGEPANFGNTLRLREEAQEIWGWRWLDDAWHDLRYGCRALRLAPGFTAVAVLTLTLGIGANSAIFSVVDAILLKPLPYPGSDRLVRVREKGRNFGSFKATSWPNFQDWSARRDIFEQSAALAATNVALTGAGEPVQILGARVTASLFTVLGVKPMLGRGFLPAEDAPGAAPVAVVSEGLWARRLGSDPAIVGKTLTLNAKNFTVVGVLPCGFELLTEASDVLLPYVPDADERRANHTGDDAIALLKRGVPLEQAQAALDTIGASLEKQFPESNSGVTFHLFRMQELLVRDVRTALLVILGAVALVLLIACANLANLTMSRVAGRRRELAGRAALGAGSGRLTRQLLTECILLSGLGGGLGLLLARWGIRFLVAMHPPGIPRMEQIALDPRVFAFTLATSALTGILFGLTPALQARRLDVTRSLKEGARGAAAHFRRDRLRRALVISEVALAVLPAIAAALLIRSFVRIETTNPGFQPDHVLTMKVSMQPSRYAEMPARAAFVERAIESIQELPGVEYAGGATYVPLTSGGNWQTGIEVEGQPPQESMDSRPSAETAIVAGAFFPAMGIPLKEGRLFENTDTIDAPGVMVIDETLARRFWPNESALGKHISMVGDRREIVGVVGHVKTYGVTEPSRIQAYLWAPQATDRDMTFVVRTKARPEDIHAAVARAIGEIDKDLPLFNVRTMPDLVSDSTSQRRFSMMLLALFAALALALAAVGVYGVMSHLVSQRLHEMGIRLALGARPGEVLRMLLRQGMALVFAGLVVGVAAAAACTQVIASLLFEVSATDAAVFVTVPLLLGAVGIVANLLPAWRATKVDPLECLRWE
jgi:putative ABC transport system permease protein